MHQSCTVPEVARLVSCLLGRETYGYRYGKAVRDVVELEARKSFDDALQGTVSVEKASSLEGSGAATEKRCGQVHDAYIAQGQGLVASFVSECTQRLQVHDGSLSASYEKVEFAVQDMPIVGTSSSEKQVDTSVADERRGSAAEFNQDSKLGVLEGASVKRERSQEDLQDSRADKRVKVESDVGLLCDSVHGNGTGPTVLKGVKDCQDTKPGELARDRDDLTPLLRGSEISTAAPIDTDLTGLFNDLDDAGDSDLEDDEFGVGSDFWPETLSDTWLGNCSITENRGQARTPETETIAKLPSEQVDRDLDIGTKTQGHTPQPETSGDSGPSSKQAQRGNDIGTVVQAHTPLVETMATVLGSSSEQAQSNGSHGYTVPALDAVRNEKPSAEIVILDSDSDDDDDFIMFDNSFVSPHLKSTVKSELGVGELEAGISQLEKAVKIELESRKQPETNHQLYNAVMAELSSQRQPETSYYMQNAVMAELDSQREPGTSYHMQNAVMAELDSRRQPETSYHLQNAVMAEPDSQREPETSYHMQNAVMVVPESQGQSETGSQLHNAAEVEVERQRQPETSYRLGNAVKGEPGTSSEMVPVGSSQSANAVKLERGGIRQVPDSRRNHGREALTMPQPQPGFMFQTLVQDGSLKWAMVPQNTAATVSSPYPVNHIRPRPQSSGLPNSLPYGLGSSSSFAPNNVREAFLSGERAEPSRGWIPSSSSAGMPSYGGHTQPSGMGNGNHALAGQAVVSVPSSFQPAGNVQQAIISGEQAGARRSWTPPNRSAVVPYRYDGTVSTPRYEVTRALQQYRYYIDKAKDDRVKEYEARRDSISNEVPKEGGRRGLDSRPDIVAYNDIKKAKADVNPGVNVGDLPGVEVGDTFTYRHQMAVVGLHRLPNVGIDYGYPPPDNIPTATAIVMMPKAGYVDDKDFGTTILYTGQGGRKKRNQGAPFVCDQELKKGNLALAKNHERGLPVRVIRGHLGGSGSSGPGFLGYSYDGLYTIVSYEYSDGMNGFKVYKYTMARLEGQPPIPPCIAGCTSHTWNTARRAMAALPLQAVDPTVDVKPICMQVMEPPVEMKQICF